MPVPAPALPLGDEGEVAEPRLDLPGPSKPIRVEPLEEPGRPVEIPAEPEAEPDREEEREPAEVPG